MTIIMPPSLPAVSHDASRQGWDTPPDDESLESRVDDLEEERVGEQVIEAARVSRT
jgi:hypothetical protein